ncbi:MAG: aromatic ring-hydroxylating oxygenase subunit alpha [Alphaproteobacteria bacterium]
MSKILLENLKNAANTPFKQSRSLPAQIYRDDEIAELEETHIFRHDWLCAGLAAEIPNSGDYLTTSIAGEAVFCIRDKAGNINTYSNVCRHRMMQLLEGSGKTNRVTCPYHAWTYDLNGQLVGAGHMQHSEGFNKKEICLPKIRTEIWRGWIYISLNEDAEPVSETLKELEHIVLPYGMEDYIVVDNQDHEWKTNWKLLTENFMEGYHLPVAHKKTVGAWMPVEDTVFPKEVSEAFTYQTFQKDEDATYGRAHPENTKLKGANRHTSIMPTVFPTHMYVLAPDHLWYLSLRPNGVGKVKVKFGVALAPEVYNSLEDKEAWLARLVDFFDHVNEEDRFVVEGIFAGSKSSFAEPGQLSWLEREIHDFQKYLASRLTKTPE